MVLVILQKQVLLRNLAMSLLIPTKVLMINLYTVTALHY